MSHSADILPLPGAAPDCDAQCDREALAKALSPKTYGVLANLSASLSSPN